MKTIRAADLFAGAGGTSTGLTQACARLGRRLNLLAVNHWAVAVETHSANHPEADHLCADLDSVNPSKVVPGGKLDLLVASPECLGHSIARGGKPINDQSRSSAWCILRWASSLQIDTILIENVREFLRYGPLGSNGRPLKSREGETFRAFITALESLGYKVDWRILNAADYGDPTTRERLFIQARRGRRPIAWPKPTHTPDGHESLFGKTEPWRAAREIIDWSMPGASIFGRKRPLSPNTLARIAAGLRKFGGKNAEPFLVLLRGTEASHVNGSSAKSIDEPVPTLTTGKNVALCEPFILGQQSQGRPRSTGKPLPTVATDGAIALVEPFIMQMSQSGGNGCRMRKDTRPLPTITTADDLALVEPFLVTVNHGHDDNIQRRTHSIEKPCPTLTAAGKSLAVCEPFIVPTNHGKDDRSHSLDRPMPTVTTVDAWGLIEPYLVNFNGNGGAHSCKEPLDTVTTKDRFGLVQPAQLDIRFRMLQPHELAAAMSFPPDYKFAGNREQRVRQIGNAVAVRIAEALCRALLE